MNYPGCVGTNPLAFVSMNIYWVLLICKPKNALSYRPLILCLGLTYLPYLVFTILCERERLYKYTHFVQSLSCVWLFATPWTEAHQASLSFTISWSLLKLMSIELVMLSNHLSLCHPLQFCLQSFPASGSFLMNHLFTSGGETIGASASASASVLPTNNQDWFPSGLTSWISLQSKGLSRVFSNTTVQKHQFFSAQLSL